MFKYLGMYETYYLKFKFNEIIILNFYSRFLRKKLYKTLTDNNQFLSKILFVPLFSGKTCYQVGQNLE